MKRKIKALLLLALLTGTQTTTAQSLQIWKNGAFQEFTYDQVDSIVFCKPAPYVPVEAITVVNSSVDLMVGEKAQIVARTTPENATVQEFKYTPSNKSVISVDENGVVTALATGNAFVVVKTADPQSKAKSARCNVAVITDEDRTPAGVTAVDLGLPSGTLWANMNIGASNEQLPGDHFAWGETSKKESYELSNYIYYQAQKVASASGKGYTKYVRACDAERLGKDNFSDNMTKLATTDDVAFKSWGGDWRLPTKAQAEELRTICTWRWSNSGFKVTGPNGNSIFLPASGEVTGNFVSPDCGGYWTSELSESHSFSAYLLFISRASSRISVYGCGRTIGHAIRAVKNK